MPTATSTATERCRTSTTQTGPPCRTQVTLNILAAFQKLKTLAATSG
jgi:hypothetical protein